MNNLHFMSGVALAAAAAFAPVPAVAASDIALDSQVFVERVVRAENGSNSVVLQPPARVLPGDKLVFVLTYRNQGSSTATDFVITNPLPQAVAFQQSSDSRELVSIDGGRTWGRMDELRVTERDGSVRFAVPEDVTHLRWRMEGAVRAGESGRLSFRGVVR